MSIYIAAFGMVASFVGGGCYLIMNGHPGWGGFCLICGALVRVKRA